MANENFQPGDTVRLKSGGPVMTVVSVRGDEVVCDWFDEKKEVQKRVFKAVAVNKDDGGPVMA